MSNKVEVLRSLDINELIIDSYFINGFNGTKAVLEHKPDLGYFVAANLFQQIIKSKSNQSYLDQKRARLKAQTDITNENILRELINIAFSDITDTLGLSIEELKQLPPDVRRCIAHAKVKTKTYFDPSIKQQVTEEYVEVKMKDSLKAKEMINKHIGFYSEDNRQKGHNVNVLQVLQNTNPDALNSILLAMEASKPKG